MSHGRSEATAGRGTAIGVAVCIAVSAFLMGCNREGRAAQARPDAATKDELKAVPSEAPPGTHTGARGARGAQGTSSGGGAAVGVAHPDNIQAGLGAQHPLAVVVNPREGDPRALNEGKQLFISYNCADCHGGEGSGGMGPSLQDGRWHFGGSAGDVYESISEGRPDGMPSWGGRISDAQIWALVTYVRTLSIGKDVTTQTFVGGGTVDRGGH